MKYLVLSLAALLSLPAFASESISPDSVLSAQTLDFNNDGLFDRATLTERRSDDGVTDGADLYLYVSAPTSEDQSKRKLALLKQNAAWSGIMWGTTPSLESSAKGSLLLKSGNDAIGRGRWEQVLTIVYRDNQFIVAGLTYTSRDTLDPKGGGSCDLNLLTGKGKRNGKSVKHNVKALPLADWDTENLPKECQF